MIYDKKNTYALFLNLLNSSDTLSNCDNNVSINRSCPEALLSSSNIFILISSLSLFHAFSFLFLSPNSLFNVSNARSIDISIFFTLRLSSQQSHTRKICLQQKGFFFNLSLFLSLSLSLFTPMRYQRQKKSFFANQSLRMLYCRRSQIFEKNSILEV